MTGNQEFLNMNIAHVQTVDDMINTFYNMIQFCLDWLKRARTKQLIDMLHTTVQSCNKMLASLLKLLSIVTSSK